VNLNFVMNESPDMTHSTIAFIDMRIRCRDAYVHRFMVEEYNSHKKVRVMALSA